VVAEFRGLRTRVADGVISSQRPEAQS
jgi:hypothetical protein